MKIFSIFPSIFNGRSIGDITILNQDVLYLTIIDTHIMHLKLNHKGNGLYLGKTTKGDICSVQLTYDTLPSSAAPLKHSALIQLNDKSCCDNTLGLNYF